MNVVHPELLVYKVSPDLRVLLVLLVLRENVVSLVPRVNKAIPAQLVTLVKLGLLVSKVWLDPRAHAVNLATRVTKV